MAKPLIRLLWGVDSAQVGLTRVKLDLEWTTRFIAAIREADPALDEAIRQLQDMRDAMYRGDGSALANFAVESGR